ncbi:MAG: long-chain acyl-CoA synthetase [Syntrophaceae bacterium]|nr:MAG: long-chain acyl-CoA synthetase [Syntrophaceae bacterium]
MAGEVSYASKPWLKSYDKGVPEKIKYEEICMPDILDRSAAKFPDRMALNFQGYTMTYKSLKDMVDRFATCLAGMGVKKGDAVAIILPNMIPCVVAYYATLRLGAVVVLNNPTYSDRELEHQLKDSGSKILITIDLLGNRMIDLRPKTKVKQIIYTSIGDYLPFPKSILFPLVAKKEKLAADVKPANDVYKWKDCIAKSQSNSPKAKLTFDDTAMYQYTGGTTGVSKGVILTHGNISKQVQQICAWFQRFIGTHHVNLGALPFFHIFGMSCAMNLSIFQAWGDILVPRPQPQQLLEAIRKFKPAFGALVPTMYIGMLNHPDMKKTNMTCFKGFFSGSAPLPVEVIHDFEKMTGAVIVEGFGMTETTPVTHTNPFEGVRKIGSIGLPLPDTECRIVDMDKGEKDMSIGEPGEMIIRGPQVTKGYLNQPGETANLLRNGWCYTGDIATMDQDGYFYIVDRKKDMIITGGFNVYPRDVDEVYYEHPKVIQVCSIGVPDAKRGENIKLFVVLKEGETATTEELIEYGKSKLAAYKLPAEVEFRKELPKSTVGNVLRKELRAEELAKRKKERKKERTSSRT